MGPVSATIFDQVAARIGAVAASAWMFSANANLGGRAPIQALREGDVDAVKRAMLRIGEDA